MSLARRIAQLEEATQPRMGKLLRIVIDDEGDESGSVEDGIIILESPALLRREGVPHELETAG